MPSWFRVQHSVQSHPKAHRAGPDAMWLAVCSWAWSDLHATDGFIPHEVVPALAPGLTNGKASRAARKLVEVGLWHQDDHGDYRVHDYADHQDPSSDVRLRRRRAADAERQRRYRARRSADGDAA